MKYSEHLLRFDYKRANVWEEGNDIYGNDTSYVWWAPGVNHELLALQPNSFTSTTGVGGEDKYYVTYSEKDAQTNVYSTSFSVGNSEAYPNPPNGNLKMPHASQITRVKNISGEEINFLHVENGSGIDLSLEQQTPGIYIIEVEYNNIPRFVKITVN